MSQIINLSTHAKLGRQTGSVMPVKDDESTQNVRRDTATKRINQADHQSSMGWKQIEGIIRSQIS